MLFEYETGFPRSSMPKVAPAALPRLEPRYRVNGGVSIAGAIVSGSGIGVVPLIGLQDNPRVQIVEGTPMFP
jgi:hypothetical protein